jgi:hypothetical protein
MKQLREILNEYYLEWFNSYLSIAQFAEHHGLTPNQAARLVEIGREINHTKHPEE